MAKSTLSDIEQILSEPKKTNDFHYYGTIVSVNDDDTYNVSINHNENITVTAAKLAGAHVGDTVMVTVMSNGYATVTGCLGGDKDAADIEEKIDTRCDWETEDEDEPSYIFNKPNLIRGEGVANSTSIKMVDADGVDSYVKGRCSAAFCGSNVEDADYSFAAAEAHAGSDRSVALAGGYTFGGSACSEQTAIGPGSMVYGTKGGVAIGDGAYLDGQNNSNLAVVVGRYNHRFTFDEDVVFVIGNGSDHINTSNAVEVNMPPKDSTKYCMIVYGHIGIRRPGGGSTDRVLTASSFGSNNFKVKAETGHVDINFDNIADGELIIANDNKLTIDMEKLIQQGAFRRKVEAIVHEIID